jgi:glyoxylate reductase
VPPSIFLTRALPDTVMADLEARYRVVRAGAGNAPDKPLSARAIARGAAACEGLVCMLSDPVGETVLGACPDLRIVANYAAGTDNIDLRAAAARGIVVTNTPGVLSEATADLAFALLLAVARRVVEGDHLVRSGRWTGWGPMVLLGSDVQARRLGIVGLGRIGQAVARRAQGFGMDIVYHGRKRAPKAVETALGARRVPLGELLSTSDFISLHCPLTPETRHLLDREALGTVKRGAYLINTARGEVVDEAALIEALETGRLTGAGLDVFVGEPRVNPRLLALNNVVLAPHAGSATYATRTRMGQMVVANLDAFFAGDVPPNRVA